MTVRDETLGEVLIEGTMGEGTPALAAYYRLYYAPKCITYLEEWSDTGRKDTTLLISSDTHLVSADMSAEDVPSWATPELTVPIIIELPNRESVRSQLLDNLPQVHPTDPLPELAGWYSERFEARPGQWATRMVWWDPAYSAH